MSATIQLRRGTAAAWTSANPTLAEGEVGVETDTLAYKIGDGSTAWTSLAYRELAGTFAAALILDAVANPSAPADGSLALYAFDIGGRILPKFVGPSGIDNPIQPALWSNGIVLMGPATTTTFTTTGIGAPTAVGTVSTPAIVSGVSLRSQMRRSIVTSAATANAASELRHAVAQCYRGEVFGSTPVGGFFLTTRWAISSATALQRTAVGLFATTAAIATTQSPSALTNCILLGNDSADTNMQLMHNDASGTCTKIDLGASFPANTAAAVYDLTLFSKPNGDEVGYRVLRVDTGAVTSGTLTTDLPPKTTLLSWHAYANNGGTAAAVVLELMRLYLETDY